MKYIFLLMVAFFSVASAIALEQPLTDAAQEAHSKELFKNLRCEVCEGQSVMDSESDFAKAVRQLVRDSVKNGLGDKYIYDTLRKNYGQDIIFKPPFDGKTALLWLLPFIAIIGGLVIIKSVLKQNNMNE